MKFAPVGASSSAVQPVESAVPIGRFKRVSYIFEMDTVKLERVPKDAKPTTNFYMERTAWNELVDLAKALLDENPQYKSFEFKRPAVDGGIDQASSSSKLSKQE